MEIPFDTKNGGAVYGVIGDPIKHSQSPKIHQYFAQQEKKAIDYRAFLVTESGLASFIDLFFASGGQGLNVTAPHKAAVLQHVHKVLPRAEQARAANTIIRDNRGSLCADNTDGYGLFRDFERLGIEVSGRNVVILGAGGAVSGLLGMLVSAKPKSLTLVNRTLARAEAIAQWFPEQVSATSFSNAPTTVPDLIINGLSAGIDKAREQLPLRVSTETVAYDLNYGERTAEFSAWMSALGCHQVYDGLGMLWHQAAEAHRLWHGRLPPVDPRFRD